MSRKGLAYRGFQISERQRALILSGDLPRSVLAERCGCSLATVDRVRREARGSSS